LRLALSRAFASGVLLLCAGAAYACDRGPPGRDTRQLKVTLSEVVAAYTPEQAAALDLGLTASIKLQLLFDREVSGRRINVDTGERVVTLRGVVETEAEGSRARRIAQETHGVAQVVDELTLRTARGI
jgi:osmotically-inducible protein OsmY